MTTAVACLGLALVALLFGGAMVAWDAWQRRHLRRRHRR